MALASRVTEAAFVASRRDEWTTLGDLVRIATERGPKRLSASDLGRLSPLYRDVCADLARAQAARYSAPLVAYLQGLTAAGLLVSSTTIRIKAKLPTVNPPGTVIFPLNHPLVVNTPLCRTVSPGSVKSPLLLKSIKTLTTLLGFSPLQLLINMEIGRL